VLGKGKVKIHVTVNGVSKNITFDDVLYIPDLRSNLISLSKLGEKGVRVLFDEYKAQIKTVSGDIVIKAKRSGRLYEVEVNVPTPAIFVTQAKRKPVPFDTWHHRLGHTGTNTICKMATKNLVNGLNILGELTMRERCKDCIFGKHTKHPFNNQGYRETKVLERIHVNIWRPSQTLSAGGADGDDKSKIGNSGMSFYQRQG